MKKTMFWLIFIFMMSTPIFCQEYPLDIVTEEQSNLSWNFNNLVKDSLNVICYTKNFEQSTYLFLQFLDFEGNLLLGDQGVLLDSTYIGDITNYHVSMDTDHNIYVTWSVSNYNSTVKLQKISQNGLVLWEQAKRITPVSYTGNVTYLKSVPDTNQGVFLVWHNTDQGEMQFAHYNDNRTLLSSMNSYGITNCKLNTIPQENLTFMTHSDNNLKYYKITPQLTKSLINQNTYPFTIEQINMLTEDDCIYIIYNNINGNDIYISKLNSNFSNEWNTLLPLNGSIDVEKFLFKKDSNQGIFASVFYKNYNNNQSSGMLYKINSEGNLLWNSSGIEAYQGIIDAYYSHFSTSSNSQGDIAITYPFTEGSVNSLKLKIFTETGDLISEQTVSDMPSDSKFICDYNQDKILVVWANYRNFLKFKIFSEQGNDLLETPKFLNSDIYLYNPLNIKTNYGDNVYNILFSSFKGCGVDVYYQSLNNFDSIYPNPVKLPLQTDKVIYFDYLKAFNGFDNSIFAYLSKISNEYFIHCYQASATGTSRYLACQFTSDNTKDFIVSNHYTQPLLFWQANNNIYCQKINPDNNPAFNISGKLVVSEASLISISNNVMLYKKNNAFYIYIFNNEADPIYPENQEILLSDVSIDSKELKIYSSDNRIIVSYLNNIGINTYLQIIMLSLNNNDLIITNPYIVSTNLSSQNYIVYFNDSLYMAYRDNNFKLKKINIENNSLITDYIEEINNNLVQSCFSLSRFIMANQNLNIIFKSEDDLVIVNKNLALANNYFSYYDINSITVSNVYDILTTNGSNYYIISKTTYQDTPGIQCIFLQNLNQMLSTEEPQVTLKTLSSYPNPFNPSTTINFCLKHSSKVDLSIYNIKGQKVKNLIRQNLSTGNHQIQWDGLDSNNKKQSSGVYFVRLKTDDKVETHKILLIK